MVFPQNQPQNIPATTPVAIEISNIKECLCCIYSPYLKKYSHEKEKEKIMLYVKNVAYFIE
jgi:hypothetical protein